MIPRPSLLARGSSARASAEVGTVRIVLPTVSLFDRVEAAGSGSGDWSFSVLLDSGRCYDLDVPDAAFAAASIDPADRVARAEASASTVMGGIAHVLGLSPASRALPAGFRAAAMFGPAPRGPDAERGRTLIALDAVSSVESLSPSPSGDPSWTFKVILSNGTERELSSKLGPPDSVSSAEAASLLATRLGLT